ncbi:MAG: amidohydrolase family protein [bacterium]|nr:amidohydrolase family protein [bacterium]
MGSTLFTNINILDGNAEGPVAGEVGVADGRISDVATNGGALPRDGQRVIDGRGMTLMSGLCDAHTHFTWNSGGSLDALAGMPVEDHTIVAVESARILIDSGYTMCVGAASAKERIDIAARDAIDAGMVPGPRYLACGQELATPAGVLVYGITREVSGAEEMSRAVREMCGQGVDNIKLILSGESITERVWAKDTYMTDEEVRAAVVEAHRVGKKVAAHARSTDSIKQCLRQGVDIIYHASYIDDEAADMMEERRDDIFVAPGLHWLYATLYEAADFGYPQEAAEAVGYKDELEHSIIGLKEIHKRGVRVLPGGDYGFAWTPHGTNARDLQHFVELLDFTPMETIRAATVLGGEIFGRPDELGRVAPGYLADLLLVKGDPSSDITVLQDHDNLVGIMKDGKWHKDPAMAGM